MPNPSTKPCGHKDQNGQYDCKEGPDGGPAPRHREGAVYCWTHEREYQEDRKRRRALGITSSRRAPVAPTFDGLRFSQKSAEDEANTPARKAGHDYKPSPELLQLWESIVKGVIENGDPPENIFMFGEKGSGKTDGAAHLADIVGLEFTKWDAASMTDPESWFGTREVVVEDGASVTRYTPSDFVNALQKPGVLFVDEMNRTGDDIRQVLLPVLDGTGRVTNPLTGEVIIRHPQCFIIMSGNRGLKYTGVFAIDPAFTSRCNIVEFEYLDPESEEQVLLQETGVDEETAKIFVRFAQDTRNRAKVDEDFPATSTRELIMASRRVARGMARDLAAKIVFFNAASPEGGERSVRQELMTVWAGVRVTGPQEKPAESSTCSECGTTSLTADPFCPACGAVFPPKITQMHTGEVFYATGGRP